METRESLRLKRKKSRKHFHFHKRRKNKANRPQRRHPLGHFVVLLALLGAMAVTSISGLFCYYVSTAPKLTTSAMRNDNTVKIYDSSGALISKLGAHNRDYVKYKDASPNLVNGLTSIEDRHFFTNKGVAPARIGEATISDALGRGGIQGGSTLTQQLIKLSDFSTSAKDRTVKRKAQEAWLAMRADHTIPKKQILEYYMNKVFMGHNSYGMQTASHYYFNKSLNQLTLPQSALLAGMPQSPISYDPYSHPQSALQRRNSVLQAMLRNHKITTEQANDAENTPINSGLASTHDENTALANKEKVANDYIQQTIQELKANHFNFKSGMKVYTNLNMNQQSKMYDLANNSNKPGWPNNSFQVGSALVNSRNGKVQAMIGGRNEHTLFGMNRASQANRSNGSTNKPLMDYGPALQYLGESPSSIVNDSPFTYPGTHTKLWDFDHLYEGRMSMKNALVQSRNVPAIKALQKVGIPRARKFMDGLGLPTDPSQTSLQNGIGGYISPLQEASAYATFANGGTYHQPLEINKVVTNDGKTVHLKGRSHRAMSKRTAHMMNEMLEGVPKSADGMNAKVPGLREAGKTGTTEFPTTYKYNLPGYAAMDSWYAGYTPNLSMSVWTGYDTPMAPYHYITLNQINVAQRYYKYAMQSASKGLPNRQW